MKLFISFINSFSSPKQAWRNKLYKYCSIRRKCFSILESLPVVCVFPEIDLDNDSLLRSGITKKLYPKVILPAREIPNRLKASADFSAGSNASWRPDFDRYKLSGGKFKMEIKNKVGEVAGKVWQTLSSEGPQTVAQLKAKMNGGSEVLNFALGWLAREDKIEITQDKRSFRVNLK